MSCLKSGEGVKLLFETVGFSVCLLVLVFFLNYYVINGSFPIRLKKKVFRVLPFPILLLLPPPPPNMKFQLICLLGKLSKTSDLYATLKQPNSHPLILENYTRCLGEVRTFMYVHRCPYNDFLHQNQ